jgi:hypothetical protein
VYATNDVSMPTLRKTMQKGKYLRAESKDELGKGRTSIKPKEIPREHKDDQLPGQYTRLPKPIADEVAKEISGEQYKDNQLPGQYTKLPKAKADEVAKDLDEENTRVASGNIKDTLRVSDSRLRPERDGESSFQEKEEMNIFRRNRGK